MQSHFLWYYFYLCINNSPEELKGYVFRSSLGRFIRGYFCFLAKE